MAQVFINYKSEEKTIAIRLNDYLASCLISAWLDSEDMPAGAKKSSAIAAGIASCRCFAALLSKRYVRSNWCIRELEDADRYARDDKLVVLPIFLEDLSEMRLEELTPERRRLVESVIDRFTTIDFDRYDQLKSCEKLADAIGRHQGLAFAPVETKNVAGVQLQLVKLSITTKSGYLPTNFIQTWDFNIQHFIAYHDGEKKPLRSGQPVALSGKAPNWLFVYLTLSFKNLCPVYIYNNFSDDYVCVYDMGEPPGRVGTTLKSV